MFKSSSVVGLPFARLPLPRLPAFAATALAAAALTFAAPIATPSVVGFVSLAQADQPSAQLADFQAVLARYGDFQPHARYGEIWVPARETAPEGWHPYPPCNWVHSKDLGWYYNDKTEWGRIVHHYGRWAHDKDLGWVWVKGEEFSPAWVVWRTSEKWVGWAPLPPEQDIKEISAVAFNGDKHWIFVDAAKFSSTCGTGTTIVSAPPALYPTILTETKLVTEIRFVRGIAIFVLPPPLIINIVDIDVAVFPPWSPCFFGAWFWNWNWMVNNVVINVNFPPQHCLPPKPVMPIRIKSLPPPPPGKPSPDRRAELPPSQQPDQPGRVTPPSRQWDPPRLIDPPHLIDPPGRKPKLPPLVVVPQLPKLPHVRPPHQRPDRVIVTPLPPKGPRVVDVPPRPGKPHGNASDADKKSSSSRSAHQSSKVTTRQPVPRVVHSKISVKSHAGLANTRSKPSNLR